MKYKQKVRVKYGFYKGQIGKVIEEIKIWLSDNDYIIQLEDGIITPRIRELDLEEICE